MKIEVLDKKLKVLVKDCIEGHWYREVYSKKERLLYCLKSQALNDEVLFIVFDTSCPKILYTRCCYEDVLVPVFESLKVSFEINSEDT